MKKLKTLRNERGLSQQTLADKFNLTQQSIYKYENGLAEPDIEMLKNLSIFFGISIDYLLSNSPSSTVEDMLATLCPTEKEVRLIQNFRFLSPEEQKSIELIIQKLNK